MSNQRNPLQPMELVNGVMRFKRNKIVDDLLDFATPNGFDMNRIVGRGDYSQTDLEQFAQLIGYSLCGFHELPYVSDETATEASIVAKTIVPETGGCRDNGCDIHIGVDRED
jgi:hypothetical protein